jgi:hypothetical protein
MSLGEGKAAGVNEGALLGESTEAVKTPSFSRHLPNGIVVTKQHPGKPDPAGIAARPNQQFQEKWSGDGHDRDCI